MNRTQICCRIPPPQADDKSRPPTKPQWRPTTSSYTKILIKVTKVWCSTPQTCPTPCFILTIVQQADHSCRTQAHGSSVSVRKEKSCLERLQAEQRIWCRGLDAECRSQMTNQLISFHTSGNFYSTRGMSFGRTIVADRCNHTRGYFQGKSPFVF